VGRLAGERSGQGEGPSRPARRDARSSALPLIILALVAGLGGGVAIGWFVGHGSQEAAPTTSAAATTLPDGGTATTTTQATETTVDAGGAYGVVTVSGNTLPLFQQGSLDTAVGLAIPEIKGADFAGNEYTISANGNPKLIVALAHWCPYCREELPVLSDWLASTDLPELGVEVYLLTVFTTPDRDNYPPGPWVAEEAWSGPLLADDAAGTMANALGIASVPYNLLVAADGTVVTRATGGLSAEQLDSAVEYLVGLSTTTTTP